MKIFCTILGMGPRRMVELDVKESTSILDAKLALLNYLYPNVKIDKTLETLLNTEVKILHAGAIKKNFDDIQREDDITLILTEIFKNNIQSIANNQQSEEISSTEIFLLPPSQEIFIKEIPKQTSASSPQQKTIGNNMINYIWMGNLSTHINKVCCSLGPKSLAQHSPEAKIIVWVPERLIGDAKALFSDCPSISIQSVDAMLIGSLKHLSKSTVEEIQNTLEMQEKNKLYTAQKDLLTLVILEEFGGYFFDCTTRFTAKPNLPQVVGVKVAITQKAVDSSTEMISNYNLSPWFQVDVWVFASEPGHPVMRNALNAYLKDEQRGTTNALSMGCVGESLVRHFGMSLNPESLWLKESTPFGWRVQELTMDKIHMGLWRKMSDEAKEAVLGNAYKELGLNIREASLEPQHQANISNPANLSGTLFHHAAEKNTPSENVAEDSSKKIP
ncbi:hypothetical protein Lsan_2569 [Legionella santicrucis]|uniref:Uncharacterized protein n=1 Tax=Legionella santicrucis TaxID=45074 RepID=A0A0W0YKH2_9GAMM|nr:hypothetical protein [Legionella santicrucis]KTD57386.1 hypothetical protein Lsan_2569 [Legionella santicrucis]